MNDQNDSRLAILMRNAGVRTPEQIVGYYLGTAGHFDERKVPDWLNQYRDDTHPMFPFVIPWNQPDSRAILERVRDEVDDEHLQHFARWGLAALDEQEQRVTSSESTDADPTQCSSHEKG